MKWFLFLLIAAALVACGTPTASSDGGAGGGDSAGGGDGGGATGGGSGGGSSSSATSFFIYDQSGQLIGEYDSSGSATLEVAWAGDVPIAAMTSGATYAVQTDQLGAPRALANASNQIVWRWSSEPFGATPADEDPDGDGATVTFPLRLPGQYFDAESSLHYNLARDYDPSAGRYIEADPIGLAGGANLYGYAVARPTQFVDPLGTLPPGVNTNPPSSRAGQPLPCAQPCTEFGPRCCPNWWAADCRNFREAGRMSRLPEICGCPDARPSGSPPPPPPPQTPPPPRKSPPKCSDCQRSQFVDANCFTICE